VYNPWRSQLAWHPRAINSPVVSVPLLSRSTGPAYRYAGPVDPSQTSLHKHSSRTRTRMPLFTTCHSQPAGRPTLCSLPFKYQVWRHCACTPLTIPVLPRPADHPTVVQPRSTGSGIFAREGAQGGGEGRREGWAKGKTGPVRTQYVDLYLCRQASHDFPQTLFTDPSGNDVLG